MTEEVLISVKLDRPETENQIDELTKSIGALNEENKELIESNKQLAAQGKQNSKEFLDNSRQVELNKQKISENTASRKGLVQAIVAEDNSIKALQVRNSELIKQRNLLNTSTEEGRARIAAINSRIDENNAKIRENSSALEKQRLNIGNYASAIDGLIPGFSAFTAQLGHAVTAARAFVATPLGLVLSGIAILLTPIITYFASTAEGLDKVDVATAKWNATVEVLKDRLAGAGREIVKSREEVSEFHKELDAGPRAFIKNWGELIGKLFPQLTKDIKEAREAAESFTKTMDDLNDEQAAYNVELGELENQQKELILQSKNRTLSEEERINKIDEALRVEQQITDKRIEFADRELKVVTDVAAKRLDIQQGQFETTREFAKRLADEARVLDDELAESLLNSLKKQTDAEGAAIAVREKLQNQRDILEDKALETEKKRSEERDKRIAEERQFELDEFNRIHNEKFFAEQAALEASAEQQQAYLDKLAEMNAVRLAREKKDADDRKKLQDQEFKNKQKAVRDTEMLQQQALATASQLFGKNRAASSAITLIDTYLSAQKAYASQLIPGDPTSLIRAQLAATLAAIQGFGRVALINGIQFAKGGLLGIAQTGGVLSGPSHAGGGIKFSVGGRLGFEAEGGEAIINKRSTALFRPVLSAINRAGGGTSFETGGVVGNETRLAARDFESRLDINEMSNLINQVQTILVLEDFEAKQGDVSQNKRRATVIG